MSFILLAALLFFIYFAPGFVAIYYSTRNHTAVFLINLFFGWSLIGWIIALILACKELTGGQIIRSLIFTAILAFSTIVLFAIEMSAIVVAAA